MAGTVTSIIASYTPSWPTKQKKLPRKQDLKQLLIPVIICQFADKQNIPRSQGRIESSVRILSHVIKIAPEPDCVTTKLEAVLEAELLDSALILLTDQRWWKLDALDVCLPGWVEINLLLGHDPLNELVRTALSHFDESLRAPIRTGVTRAGS